MDQLRDALKKVVPGATEPKTAEPAVATPPGLPDPLESEWIRRFRQLGGEMPAGATWGQLTQRSDKLVRELKAAGRKRECSELQKLRDDFTKLREGRAWTLVKARFGELDLPERAYRALKQGDVDPVRLLERLTGRRGEALRGMGADRVRELLTG